MTILQQFERLRAVWADLHPWWRVALVLCVAGAVGYASALPAYRTFKDWRMERNLKAAALALEEERMQQARDLSLTVLQSGNPAIEAMRILEESSAVLGDPRHHDIARALIEHPEGADTDRLKGFRAIVMELPLGHVGRVWANLPDDLQKQPEFAAAFSQRLRSEGLLREAGGVILDIPRTKRDPVARRELARVLIASGRDEGLTQAQRLLAEGIGQDGSEEIDPWLAVLEEIPPGRLMPAALGAVGALPDESAAGDAPAHARRALAAVRVAWARADDAARGRMIDETVAAWLGDGRAHLARLLHDLGEDERLLAAIAPRDGADDAGMARTMWQSAMRAGDPELASAWLDAAGPMLPAHELAARRAMVAASAGKSTESQLAWRSAVDAAGEAATARELLDVHRLAASAGNPEASTLAMVAAIRKGRGPLPLYEAQRGLIESLTSQGRDQLVLEICSIYLSLDPWNPVLLVQYAYLASLHGTVGPERLLPPLEAMANALPGQLPVHTTLATVLMTANRPAEAAAVLEPFDMGNAQLSPSFKIVHLVSEVMNGRMAADDPAIASFPWSALQPVERRKFSALIRRPLAEPMAD